MKKIPVILLVLLLCACGQKMTPPSEVPEASIAERWQKMQAMGDNQPWRLQLSLRFGSEGDTRRVTALLWGNNEDSMRLDVQAGVGATIAKAVSEGDSFLLYSPQENKAYWHEGDNRPLLRIGIPLPFTLAQLADILNGRYGRVFGTNYLKAEAAGSQLIAYTLEKKPGGQLELDAAGLPQKWQGKDWRLTFSYADSYLPKSLRFTAKNGKLAILLIKARETPKAPFTPAQMELVLPQGTEMLPLAAYKTS